MKQENKWVIKYMLNTIGYAVLIAQAFLWIIITFAFMNGYVVFLYEFYSWIYIIEFIACLYALPFIIFKTFVFLRDYLFRENFLSGDK